MKIHAATLLPPTADFSTPDAADFRFLEQSIEAMEELSKGLKRGMESAEDSLEQRIYRLWNRCIAAVNELQGQPLLVSVRDLLKERKNDPTRFDKAVGGMQAPLLQRIFNHLAALGHLFLMFDAASKENKQKGCYHLDRAVFHLRWAGIPNSDTALAKYKALLTAR